MKNALYAATLLLAFSSAKAQFTNILISPTGCTESHIAIDPTNPARMVVGTNCAYTYYSADSGQTWAPSTNPTIVAGQWYYDACMVADNNGDMYYFHNDCNFDSVIITMQKSFDGGATWSYSTRVSHLYDKEMVCVRPQTNELYTVFIPDSGGYNNVGYSRSADGGVTWTYVSWVNAQPYTGTQWGAAPACGTSPGELYVVWENNTGVYFQKTTDNGATWQMNDMLLRAFLNTSNGFDCMPSIATDLSGGPYNGNIYITWWEKDVNGTDTDIYFAKSTDNGATFNISSIMSDINTDQKLPQITIDPTTGYIYVVYYSETAPNNIHDIKMAFSTDGGNTFNSVTISTSPAKIYNWYHHYIGNAAYNGVVRPAWTNWDSLYTALISHSQLVNWLGIQDQNIQSSLNIYPNPSQGVFYVSASVEGDLRVMNSTGELVLSGRLNGKEISFDISYMPAGLYLVSLETEHGTSTMKILKK